ncbi:hypothetical protein [Thermococcus sp.]
MEAYLVVPVQEIARGKPKFGVWMIGEEKTAYIRVKEGSWGDALKRGLAYGAGNLSMLASISAWESYKESTKEHLRSLQLPEDLAENAEKYVERWGGFIAPIKETSIKRGKGFLGNEFNGQTPVELKAGKKNVKFYVDSEYFERVIKPFIGVSDFKEYKEAKLWIF